MTALALIQYFTWTIYVVIFVTAFVQYVRRPRRANLDIALLFGICAFVIAEQVLVLFGVYRVTPLIDRINAVLLFSLPYVLLRLVDDFVGVERVFMRVAEVWFALAAVAFFVFDQPPFWITLVQFVYFVGLMV